MYDYECLNRARLAKFRAFLRRRGISGGCSLSKPTSFRSVQWIRGENSSHLGAWQANNHQTIRSTSWSRQETSRQILEGVFKKRKICSKFIPLPLTAELRGWKLLQFHRNCWRRSWRLAKNCDCLRNAVFEIQSWNETTMAWNQFPPAEDRSQKIARQDNADRYFDAICITRGPR